MIRGPWVWKVHARTGTVCSTTRMVSFRTDKLTAQADVDLAKTARGLINTSASHRTGQTMKEYPDPQPNWPSLVDIRGMGSSWQNSLQQCSR